MATYAIGDLQGCFNAFQKLIDFIQFDPAQDKLWLVGDIVNRGPDTLSSLRTIKQAGDAMIMVLGNHDLHLLMVAAGVPIHSVDTLQQFWMRPIGMNYCIGYASKNYFTLQVPMPWSMRVYYPLGQSRRPVN